MVSTRTQILLKAKHVNRIIDRRLQGKNKSVVNRQKFIRRFKTQIKRAVSDAISGRSISDIEKGEAVSIPSKDLSEPIFRHGSGGIRHIIHPGNKEFIKGDKVSRPPKQGGGGSQASNSGEGEDEFVFQLSREEFMDFFFEDLELPNLQKTKLATITEYKTVRAGFTNAGVPANINIVRSLRGAIGRRLAMGAPYRQKLKEKLAALELLQVSDNADDAADQLNKLELEEAIAGLKKKIAAIPFIDTFDLRYNNFAQEPAPSTRAVMFCVMDVSGSMGQEKKDIAKRFFMLLYLFLTRTYKHIQVVFIAHHTTAKEVEEEEFFYSRETGGTIVSSALELLQDILIERYPSNEWNIYAAQASDGDDWSDDPNFCRSLLSDHILAQVRYFAYIEINEGYTQTLWREYKKLELSHSQFAMRQIHNVNDIYPVFRDLFKKKNS